MTKEIIVVGGGASGLMAACTAARGGCRVTVLEKMPRPARKMMITGKGRCNVTNDSDLPELIASVTENGRFLYSAFSGFSPADTMQFFENAGVPLKVERGKRVFPVSDRAVDIVDALVGATKTAGARIVNGEASELLVRDGVVIGVRCRDGAEYFADAVILATGGCSYPLTGSTGDGYSLAESVGHTVTERVPSLIPLVTKDEWCATLQGLALKNIRVSFYEPGKQKPVYEDFGELLFTHFGVSGPTVLSASAHLRARRGVGYTMKIDLKPALDTATLDRRLRSDFAKNINREICHALDDLLPKRLIPVVIAKAGVSPETRVNQLTREQRDALIATLKGLEAETAGFRPIEEAVVTGGGVAVREIDPATMASKCVGGLYIVGELLDVDAYTGGFNLQIAFSTGHAAGKSVSEE